VEISAPVPFATQDDWIDQLSASGILAE